MVNYETVHRPLEFMLILSGYMSLYEFCPCLKIIKLFCLEKGIIVAHHTAEILRKRAKKCARAQNVSFCHLWGILKLLWAKKMKSVENINRYEAFPFSPQEMTRKMPLEIIFSLKLKNHLL